MCFGYTPLCSPQCQCVTSSTLGLCTLLAGGYIARKIQCYRNALSAAGNDAKVAAARNVVVVGANEITAETAGVAKETTKPNNTATAMQKEEKADDDASGPKEIPEGSRISDTNDLSNNEDGMNSIDGDHTSLERKIRDHTGSTSSITEADTRNKEGQKIIGDAEFRLVGSNTATLATVKDVTPKAPDKAPPVTPGRAGRCGSQSLLNSASKEHAGEIKDETEDEDDGRIPTIVTEKEKSVSANLHAKSCLGSSEMRQYIAGELPDFKESKSTFPVGSVTKPKFFYDATEKRYIALAHNKDESDTEAVKGGERGLSEVLNDIKNDLDSRSSSAKIPTRILIPLQQISKGHWTLLAINTQASGTGPTTATHYDSKGRFSASRAKDMLASKAQRRITKWVQGAFSTKNKVKFEYCGEQGMLDFHNCGRYVLIKLRGLLDPGATKLSIDDINKSLYRGEEQTNTQEETSGRKNKKQLMKGLLGGMLGLTSRMPNSQGSESDTLPGESSASDGWEMMGEE